MSISSDEINFLIYRYLQENGLSQIFQYLKHEPYKLYFVLSLIVGFTHTAFSFAYESLVCKSSVSETELPPGALITFLQKGLEYIAIEENIEEARILN